jgi:hypothetical protein
VRSHPKAVAYHGHVYDGALRCFHDMDAVRVQDQEGSSVYGLKDAMFLAILQSYGTDCAPLVCNGMPLGEHRHCDPGLLKDGKSDPCDIHLHVLPCFSLLTLQGMALDNSLD